MEIATDITDRTHIEKELKKSQSNAKKYFDGTVSVDVTDLYTPFLELMPVTGVILDAGCGSGRDALFYQN
jgi:hypothetical protein